jgi:hypothetical protein
MGTDNHGGIEQQKAQTSIGYVLLQLSDWREWGIGTKLVQLGTATSPVSLKEVRPVAAQVLSTTVYRRPSSPEGLHTDQGVCFIDLSTRVSQAMLNRHKTQLLQPYSRCPEGFVSMIPTIG